MRWFRPVLEPVGASPPSGADRFGGVAADLGSAGWPACAACGRPLSLIAQLAHHPRRLPLGGEGRVLSVWQCENEATACDTWDAESGANAVMVHTAHASPATVPAGTFVYPAATVAAWLEGDDGVTPDALADFFSVKGFRSLTDADSGAAVRCTQLGGVPFWVHTPDEAPPAPFELVLQIDGRDGWDGPDHLGGLAYIFLDRTVDPPRGVMFWQS